MHVKYTIYTWILWVCQNYCDMSIALLGCKDPYNLEINHITGEYNPLHKIFKQCLITCIYSQADWLDRKLPCKFMHWCLPCPWILISQLNRHILQTLPAATRREQRHLPLVLFWARKSNKLIWTKLTATHFQNTSKSNWIISSGIGIYTPEN